MHRRSVLLDDDAFVNINLICSYAGVNSFFFNLVNKEAGRKLRMK